MVGRRAALAAVITLTLAACAGDAQPSASSGAGQPDDGAAADLPQECVAEIRDFLVAIEPLVASMDFAAVSEADLERLAPASDAFDPDLCPDMSVDEARAAWLAIASESAPGAVPYIEYTYAE